MYQLVRIGIPTSLSLSIYRPASASCVRSLTHLHPSHQLAAQAATITDQEYTGVGSRCKAGTKRRKAALPNKTCPVVVPQAYIGRVVKVQKQEGEQLRFRQGTVTAIEREAVSTRGFRYRVKYDGSGGDGDGDGDGNGDGDAEEEVLSFAAMSKALVS